MKRTAPRIDTATNVDHPRGHRGHQLQVVGRDDRTPAPLGDAGHGRGQSGARGGVHAARRLVQEHQRGVAGEHRGEGRALPLAGAEVPRIAIGHCGEAQFLQRRVGPARRAGAPKRPGDLRAHRRSVQEGGRILGEVRDPAGTPLDAAGQRREQPGDGAQQGGLAAAVGTGERHHLARTARQVEVVQHRHPSGAGAHPVEAPAELRRDAGTTRHRARGGLDRHVRGAGGDPPPAHDQAAIGTLSHQVVAVLRHQRGGAGADGGLERGEEGRRPRRVELREGLVEDQQARSHRQHPGQGQALPLAAGEGADRTAAQVGDAADLESIADPAEHLAAGNAEVLQPEGGVALDGRVHGLQLGVLEHESDVAGQLAGRGAKDVAALDAGAASDHSPVEVGDEPVADPEQGRLAASRGTGEEGQSGADLQIHPVEGAVCGPRIGVVEAGKGEDGHLPAHPQ
jgi:hypothetical protein